MSQVLKVQSVPIDRIVVKGRHRKEGGDRCDLIESMREIGLLQPIGITSDMVLVIGERRYNSAVDLGWPEIPAVILESIADASSMLRAERDENTCRKPMTASELVELGKSIEAVAKEESAKRQAATQIREGVLPVVEPVPPPGNKGKTRDIVGKAIGVSGKTFGQMKKVVDHGTPELVGAMDDGDLSVKVAAQVADLPPAVQREIVFSQDPRETAKEVVEELSRDSASDEIEGCDQQSEDVPTEGEKAEEGEQFIQQPTPQGIADTESPHPHAKLLQAIVNLASRISAEVNDADSDAKIRRYLLDIGFVYPRAKIVGDRRYGWQCIGLRGLYRVVKLAGLPGRTKGKEKLLKAYQDAAQPEGDK